MIRGQYGQVVATSGGRAVDNLRIKGQRESVKRGGDQKKNCRIETDGTNLRKAKDPKSVRTKERIAF